MYTKEFLVVIFPLLFTLGITPITRWCALRFNICDRPRQDPLKIHDKPVPLLGGLALFISLAAGLCILNYFYSFSFTQLTGILAGACMVMSIGICDDIKNVKAGIRLIVHVCAGLIIFLSGIMIGLKASYGLSILLTLFYVVGAINAFNVTDGMDGLCTGLFLISCVGFFLAGAQERIRPLMFVSLVFFMSALGFLPYNFYPAKIFLGDSGSGLLGFLCAVMAVLLSISVSNAVQFIRPILIVGIPVLDMGLAIVRRLMRGKSPFAGDRDHLYDFLLKKGMTQPKVWSIMCILQCALVALALYI